MTINLPEEFVLPNYRGGSIANIPATVASLLNVPFQGLPPLAAPLWQPLDSHARRVIIFLIDAWGWNLFRQERERLAWLERRSAVLGKITSVFPSTTVAALSSLWTGYAPAQHGLVGLQLFFPEQAVLGQLISFKPTFGPYPGALVDAGVDPLKFLEVPGFAQQLAAAAIPSHAFKGREIVHSALSQMHDRGVTGEHSVVTLTDMFVHLRHLLEETAGQSLYVNAYWPAIDTLSHVYGPEHISVASELHAILGQMRTELLDALSPAARQGTVLFITGDHGQVFCPPEQIIPLDDHPVLQQLLLMRPAGEPRTAYLYARQGQKAAVHSYLAQRLGHALVSIDAQEALAGDLLGPPPHADQTAGRVGDLMAIMRQGYLLITAQDQANYSSFIGRHGGMTADEMEVPWIGLDLAH
jgi:hypothetical protein